MDDMLKDFCDESKGLCEQLDEILDKVESDVTTQVKHLEGFGQIVDRIMGGAKILALDYPPEHPVHAIGTFTELCKLIGYKASQVTNNPNLTTVVVAFLQDAMETLEALLEEIVSPQPQHVSEFITMTFIDRLKWLATKFDENLRATVAVSKESAQSTQNDVEALLRQMGVKS
jgi:hypothetical protein